jgi:hypothetical protein
MSKEAVNSALLVALWAYSSNLKMATVRSSQTGANFYRTTQHHTPDDSGLTSQSSSSKPHISKGNERFGSMKASNADHSGSAV